MSTINLSNGESYSFAKVNNNAVITNSSDKAEGGYTLRAKTYNFHSGSLSIGGGASSAGIVRIVHSYISQQQLYLSCTNANTLSDVGIQFNSTAAGEQHWIGINGANGEMNISANGQAVSAEGICVAANDKVGINQSSPQESLHVNGHLRISGGSKGIKYVDRATSGDEDHIYIYMDGDNRATLAYFERDSNNKFWQGYDGNDSSAPYYTWFHYNGSGYEGMEFRNNGTLYVDGSLVTTSDIRLKEMFRELDSRLDKVCALNGVKFDWKSEAKPNDNIGLLAQEVEKIIPEVVHTSEKLADGEDGSPEVDNPKSVEYANLVPYLVEAIKELTEKVKDLEIKLENK